MFGGFLDLGNSITSILYNVMEVMARQWHHYGETNRYSKEPIELSDGPLIEKPSALGRLQYQRYRYSALYHDEPAATSVVGGKNTVRLLELLQPETTNSELIRCKLHTYSLDEAPEYEAISYTWGVVNTQDFPVIVVTGTETQDNTLEAVEITRHLYAALRRLRHPTQPRFLWADQICINQADKEEKSTQVRQMGDIYKKSKRTVIWLGEEDWDKDVIAEMFTSLTNTPFTSVKDDFGLFKGLLDLEQSAYTAPHMIPRKQWRRQAVTRLLNQTWFSRTYDVYIVYGLVSTKELAVTWKFRKFSKFVWCRRSAIAGRGIVVVTCVFVLRWGSLKGLRTYIVAGNPGVLPWNRRWFSLPASLELDLLL